MIGIIMKHKLVETCQLVWYRHKNYTLQNVGGGGGGLIVFIISLFFKHVNVIKFFTG